MQVAHQLPGVSRPVKFPHTETARNKDHPLPTELRADHPWIKNGAVAEDIYQNLLRILRYESKDTTYKFAVGPGMPGLPPVESQ